MAKLSDGRDESQDPSPPEAPGPEDSRWDDTEPTDDDAPDAPLSANGSGSAMAVAIDAARSLVARPPAGRLRRCEAPQDSGCDAHGTVRIGGASNANLAHIGDVLRSELVGGTPRIALGIAPLDSLCGGGVRAGSLVFLAGAPGAGKTTLALQVAIGMARCGASVRWAVYDEAAPPIVVRLLQSLGLPRAQAEQPDPAAVDASDSAFDALDFRFGEGLLEDVVASWPTGPVRVLIVDSVQTARTRTSDRANGPRERVDDVLAALRLVAANGVLVIATSELNRGAYRNQASADATDPLSAAKESGSIEYAASLLLVLRSLKGDPELVHVVVAKNRLGKNGSLGLRLDRDLCSFTPAEVSHELTHAQHEADLAALARKALSLIAERPGWTTDALRGELHCSRDRVQAVLKRLTDRREIRNEGGTRRSNWVPATALEVTSTRPPESSPVDPGTTARKRRRRPVVPTPSGGTTDAEASDRPREAPC